jgi:hypothetical protein
VIETHADRRGERPCESHTASSRRTVVPSSTTWRTMVPCANRGEGEGGGAEREGGEGGREERRDVRCSMRHVRTSLWGHCVRYIRLVSSSPMRYTAPYTAIRIHSFAYAFYTHYIHITYSLCHYTLIVMFYYAAARIHTF